MKIMGFCLMAKVVHNIAEIDAGDPIQHQGVSHQFAGSMGFGPSQ